MTAMYRISSHLSLGTGQPADNAAHFVEWLTNLKGSGLSNVAFGVFGCGNHDWVSTYQRIPKLVDQSLADCGAKRIVERGEGDAGGSGFFEVFDKWETQLWASLTEVIPSSAVVHRLNLIYLQTYQTKEEVSDAGVKLQIVDTGGSRATILRQSDTKLGTVIENRILTAPGAPPKRHLRKSIVVEGKFGNH